MALDETRFTIILASGMILSFIGTMASIVLSCEAPADADKPNVTDWLQGWGNIGGVVVGAAAAFAVDLVDRQGQQALRNAEQRRLEDLE